MVTLTLMVGTTRYECEQTQLVIHAKACVEPPGSPLGVTCNENPRQGAKSVRSTVSMVCAPGIWVLSAMGRSEAGQSEAIHGQALTVDADDCLN